MAHETPPVTSGTPLTEGDARMQALTNFKDWSNYLLVTTVAALGWIAEHMTDPTAVDQIAIWSLAVSAVFGIFTLALVPLVAEQIASEHTSIYLVRAQFHLAGERGAYLRQACRPQHLLFIVGVLAYAVSEAGAGAGALLVPLVACVGGVALWFLSVVRNDHRSA